MTIRMTYQTKKLILDSGFDTIFDSGVLEIRSGPQPAAASDAPTGTLLWTETLPANAFGAATDPGIKDKAGTWSANGAANGTAGYWRLKASGDTGAVSNAQARIDGSISLPGGGGDMNLNSMTIVSGQQVDVLSCIIKYL